METAKLWIMQTTDPPWIREEFIDASIGMYLHLHHQNTICAVNLKGYVLSVLAILDWFSQVWCVLPNYPSKSTIQHYKLLYI